MPSAQRFYSLVGNSHLWDVATECSYLLSEKEIPHLILGGVAVCLHGYQRNSSDVDFLIRPQDESQSQQILEDRRLIWEPTLNCFDSLSGAYLKLLIAGELAGRNQDVVLPDPANLDNCVRIEGLPIVTLAKLIETKIACGAGSLRRIHKDFADVVELIAIHKLTGDFSRFLHKSVRKTFRELVHNAESV